MNLGSTSDYKLEVRPISVVTSTLVTNEEEEETLTNGYVVINLKTNVIESSCYSLPTAINYMIEAQKQLDEVRFELATFTKGPFTHAVNENLKEQ